jgi:CRP-like cAMP-binding protein
MPGQQRLDLLKRIWLFSDLPDADLAQIAGVARETTCRAGEVLVRQGEISGDLFAVIQGRLKVSSVADGGEEVLLSLLKPGQIFGEIALLDEEPRSATVVAAEACRFLVVPRDAFRTLLHQVPALATGLLKVMARHVRRLSLRAEDMASLDVRARLAKTLLGLADQFGVAVPGQKTRITLRLSQQELGRLIGATREMVNKCLREWTERKIVSYVSGILMVLKEHRLREILEETGLRRERAGR